ncbi:MAG TPA: hypothetical protein VGQ36_04555 [Thermoanaerobaculia bacterium]|jgi:hypothetical protein|nr:hypothetical protein [Thermoanaerobaculia bacterium]
MRTVLVTALLVLSAFPASASELYIVPAYANRVSNGTMSWYSEVFVTNPHRHLVELELETMIGESEPHGCRFPEYSLLFPTTLAPGETRRLCMPFLTSGAFAFRATHPLVVTSEMIAVRGREASLVFTRQTIEPGRRWIEPGEQGVIFNVRVNPPQARANLVLMNPGGDPITVRYTMVRIGSSPPVNHAYEPVEGSVEMAGQSVMIVPLPDTPRHDCRRLFACGNAEEHEVVVEATGRFYAATSSVENDLDGSFRSPIIRSAESPPDGGNRNRH